MQFCHEVYIQLYVQIVVFRLVTPCVNDLLMLQNSLLLLPSGFTSTLKMEAAYSFGMLTCHMSIQYHKPKDHIEVSMAIKILNLNSWIFNLLLNNIHKENIDWRFISQIILGSRAGLWGRPVGQLPRVTRHDGNNWKYAASKLMFPHEREFSQKLSAVRAFIL